jgi:endonuclease/exonuclease/phosphatase family metal-dependent hydrolase
MPPGGCNTYLNRVRGGDTVSVLAGTLVVFAGIQPCGALGANVAPRRASLFNTTQRINVHHIVCRVVLCLSVLTAAVSAAAADGYVVWRGSTGTWYAASGFPGTSTSQIPWGDQAAGDVPFRTDVDGDGTPDLVLWRASTGYWHVLQSSTRYAASSARTVHWGSRALGDIPLVGDLDGDGRADLITWRASTGEFFWLTSSSGYSGPGASRQWGHGRLGDVPVVGDVDGDGRSDLAVWRPSTGWWYWLTSSTNYSTMAGSTRQFGSGSVGDMPMTADMDGDGRDDLVVWRATTGVWYWLSSSSSGLGMRQWGARIYGDRPLLGDVDGDGRADITVFRDPTGKWYSLTAASGYSTARAVELTYGGRGDLPVVANRFRNTRRAATTTPVTTPTPAPAPTPTVSGVTLRVLQWNIHHGGFGTDGVYSPDRVATWAASFKPDVITFNEIEKYTSWGNQDQPEVYKALLQQKTGKTWYYVFAQEYGNWSANGKGNLILSTYPIAASERYELVHNADRSIALAQITVNSRNITLMSTHLDPYDASLRLTQATEVTGWAAPQPENRIITGDMNAWPDQSSIAHFRSLYHDSWAVAAANGAAIAFSGNSGETKNGRIDYIFYSKSSANLQVVSSQVYDTRDSAGVTPSDHRPVLTTFVVK